MAFPDERDRDLMSLATDALDVADDLIQWLSEFNEERAEVDLAPISQADEFQLFSLRRKAGNLLRSSRVPVAAAVYGASQVGKSLFVGRVLRAANADFCPLGRDEVLGPPAYYPGLNFDQDLNPQCGSNEATAVVTRFTTKDRFDETVPTRFPVLARGLSRAEWLRVMARGFRSECDLPAEDLWHDGYLEELFAQQHRHSGAEEADHHWRMDLLDVYSYLKRLDPLRFRADESFLNGLISRYPLTRDGYVQVVARLCWGSWPTLTKLFNSICEFLEEVHKHGREGVACHWAAVRFLLDSQRTPQHENRESQVFPKVAWSDLVDRFVDGWYVLDYQPGQGPPRHDLATIQSALLEIVIPVLPDRLNSEWRAVLEQIDILDIPGMRSQGRGAEEGLLKSADSIDDRMSIVKRGKVFYLFERYIEEMQIQTLLLLIRSGNLEVKGLLKEYVDKWGRTRYGKDVWPARVADDPAALFIGMTGIDDEFRTRDPKSEIYNARLRIIASETFKEVMTDFGGRGKRFTNIYPIRYPGSWDSDAEERAKFGAERWEQATHAFVEAEMVSEYVADYRRKWAAAMDDRDGGASLIAAGFRNCTSAVRKQNELYRTIAETDAAVRQLALTWAVDPNANVDRDRRIAAAKGVIEWCTSDPQLVYGRINALRDALCFRPGDVICVADLADMCQEQCRRPESLDRRLGQVVPALVGEWARQYAPQRWQMQIQRDDHSGESLNHEQFATFARYLADYLCSGPVMEQLLVRLFGVISLQHQDQVARKNARRKLTRLILNDFVMNPGPDMHPLEESKDRTNTVDYGLMTAIVERWSTRLPQALGSAAGDQVCIPPGNGELHELLMSRQIGFGTASMIECWPTVASCASV